MRLGLQIPSYSWPGGVRQIAPRLIEVAQAAEEAGFFSLWVMDHFFQIEGVGSVDDSMLEAYSTLSYLAGRTQTVRLGALVTGVIYRYPGILIKTVSTLDVLSGGRAYFGIGAGWYEREAVGLGVPFPPWAARFEMLEEILEVAHQMWSGDSGSYQGKHYRLSETLNSPQPLSQPHPPILVGGMGEKKTLRLVAQYADACNLVTSIGLEGLRSKLEILRRHCDAVGRSYEEIERTVLGGIDISAGKVVVKDVIRQCRSLADLGFQHFIINIPATGSMAALEAFAQEIVPVVAEY